VFAGSELGDDSWIGSGLGLGEDCLGQSCGRSEIAGLLMSRSCSCLSVAVFLQVVC
jgi:hypothetical protein